MFSLRLRWREQDERNNKENVGRKNDESVVDQYEGNDLILASVGPLKVVGLAAVIPDDEQNDCEKQGNDQCSEPK
jgi:hypothetical protein